MQHVNVTEGLVQAFAVPAPNRALHGLAAPFTCLAPRGARVPAAPRLAYPVVPCTRPTGVTVHKHLGV